MRTRATGTMVASPAFDGVHDSQGFARFVNCNPANIHRRKLRGSDFDASDTARRRAVHADNGRVRLGNTDVHRSFRAGFRTRGRLWPNHPQSLTDGHRFVFGVVNARQAAVSQSNQRQAGQAIEAKVASGDAFSVACNNLDIDHGSSRFPCQLNEGMPGKATTVGASGPGADGGDAAAGGDVAGVADGGDCREGRGARGAKGVPGGGISASASGSQAAIVLAIIEARPAITVV